MHKSIRLSAPEKAAEGPAGPKEKKEEKEKEEEKKEGEEPKGALGVVNWSGNNRSR